MLGQPQSYPHIEPFSIHIEDEMLADLRARIRVPTGIAVFAHQFVDDGEPPREWAERLYSASTMCVSG